VCAVELFAAIYHAVALLAVDGEALHGSGVRVLRAGDAPSTVRRSLRVGLDCRKQFQRPRLRPVGAQVHFRHAFTGDFARLRVHNVARAPFYGLFYDVQFVQPVKVLARTSGAAPCLLAHGGEAYTLPAVALAGQGCAVGLNARLMLEYARCGYRGPHFSLYRRVA
jgi:hypothetical protein